MTTSMIFYDHELHELHELASPPLHPFLIREIRVIRG